MFVLSHVVESVEEFLNAHSDDVDPLSTNVDEVTRVVRSLKNRKAPGFDSIRSLTY